MGQEVALLTGGRDKHYALDLVRNLTTEGVVVDFIGSDALDSPELQENPRVRFLNLRGDTNADSSLLRKMARVVNYYWRLVAYAATAEPRIFHILWNNKLEILDRTVVLLYYRLLGKRIVFTAHNVNAGKGDGTDGIVNRLTLRAQYRLVDHVFVHTEKMSRELQTDFGVSRDRISVIPFGINNAVPKTTLTSVQARELLDLDQSHQVVLFFGNIAPYKGLHHLVEAMAIVGAALPKCRLIVAGRVNREQRYWAAIERRISELGLTSRVVRRIEFVPDHETEVYFKASDVLVLPYTYIFQSGVLFLSYSFGLPVIATDVGSLKEYIVEGVTGSVCQPQDPSSLAGALRAYFSGDLYRQLPSRRTEIQRMAGERYSWAKAARIISKVYKTIDAI